MAGVVKIGVGAIIERTHRKAIANGMTFALIGRLDPAARTYFGAGRGNPLGGGELHAAGKPLKKLDAPKPKVEKTETSPIPEDDSNTFTLDAVLRETLDILSDYVRLRDVLPNVSRRD